MGEINYFTVVKCVQLRSFGCPGFERMDKIEGGVKLVKFVGHSIDDPDLDPIGLFYEDGIRLYLWREKIWADFDLPSSPFLSALNRRIKELRGNDSIIELETATEMVDVFSSHVDPADHRSAVPFYRVIYQINRPC